MKKTLLSLGVVLAGFTASAQYFSASTAADFSNFSSYDADGDSLAWEISDLSTDPALGGQGEVLMSFSYDNATQSPLTPDNILFTPVINLTGATGTIALQFKAGSPETTASGWYEEFLSVYAFDGYSNMAAALASPIHSEALEGGEEMFFFTYNLSSFAGADSLIIAFRHHNSTDEFAIVLDEINVVNYLNINENVVDASVFPNPATDVLNISAKEEEVVTINVVTMDGKVVMTANGASANVADLRTGMYIYEAVMASGKVARGNFAKK
jgi:hypothetical protein